MPLLLLASCKSLSVLKCNDIIEGVLTQTSGHHFCFPYLTQLALRTSAYNISLLLDIITTPALIQLDLTIELAEDPVADWTEAVFDLAKCSSFSIQELFLGDRGYNDEVNDVSAVLAQLLPANSIRTINISVPDFSDALLSDPVVAQLALAICNGYGREPGEDCLPTLAEFIYDGNISLSLEAISQMLRSRLICDKKYKEKLNAYRMANDSKPSLGELGSNDGRLELSRTETPKWSSNASSRTGFIMSITYRNIDWFQQQNSNEMQAFYRLVEEFSTEGRQFKLHYGGDIDES